MPFQIAQYKQEEAERAQLLVIVEEALQLEKEAREMVFSIIVAKTMCTFIVQNTCSLRNKRRC